MFQNPNVNPGRQNAERPLAMNQLSGPTLRYSIAECIQTLRAEPTWLRERRNAMVLVKEPDIRVTLLLLGRGIHIDRHIVTASATLHVMHGDILVHIEGQDDIRLAAGEIVALEPDIPHDVECIADEACFLLTTGWRLGARNEPSEYEA